MDDPQWLSDLFFITDINRHLFELNKKLQGKGQLAFDLHSAITAFESKLLLFATDVASEKLFFPRLAQHDKSSPAHRYVEVIEQLSIEFRDRFADFNRLAPAFKFVLNPFIGEPLLVAKDLAVLVRDEDISDTCLELCDLQSNLHMQQCFKADSNPINFWGKCPSLPHLRLVVQKVFSLWGSTYVCEQTFSNMNYIKSKYRTNLTDDHLESLLRISAASSSIVPRLSDLNKAMQSQVSH